MHLNAIPDKNVDRFYEKNSTALREIIFQKLFEKKLSSLGSRLTPKQPHGRIIKKQLI